MSDTQKLLRIYIDDTGIRVMGLVGAAGVTLTLMQRDLAALGLFAMGWCLYLLEEHLIHRFVFHAPAPKNQFLFDLLYRLHYGHHDQQRSRDLLFTPLWFALPIALVTVGALLIFLPRPMNTVPSLNRIVRASRAEGSLYEPYAASS